MKAWTLVPAIAIAASALTAAQTIDPTPCDRARAASVTIK